MFFDVCVQMIQNDVWMYSAEGGQIMRLKYVPIYSQHKNNIF